MLVALEVALNKFHFTELKLSFADDEVVHHLEAIFVGEGFFGGGVLQYLLPRDKVSACLNKVILQHLNILQTAVIHHVNPEVILDVDLF